MREISDFVLNVVAIVFVIRIGGDGFWANVGGKAPRPVKNAGRAGEMFAMGIVPTPPPDVASVIGGPDECK